MEMKALIFDSVYDDYRGVVVYVRLFQGSLAKGDELYLLLSGKKIEVLECGYFSPSFVPQEQIFDGEIAYVITGLKNVREARVGDTLWSGGSGQNRVELATAEPLVGYEQVRPNVFAGIFPNDADDYNVLRSSLDKLALSDAALVFEPENSPALGHGFRCGFLGLLHMEIVQERLEREYDLDIIVTAPSVSYEILEHSGKKYLISAPMDLPDRTYVASIAEPFVLMDIFVPQEYVGVVMELAQSKRGVFKDIIYPAKTRADIRYEIPLAEVVTDFYDRLKSATAGYASLTYDLIGYRVQNLLKVDILVAGDNIDALSFITHADNAYREGSVVVKKLKDIIPRSNFAISLQAAQGANILARETIPAFRKDVTSGLYGGDISRKKKLLKKQKAGKKRMKSVGKITLPQSAFMTLLQK